MLAPSLLVVEDDEDILELLRYNLESAGFSVRAYADGRQGLVAARERVPDLILLDLMLPGMDGLDVCRELKRSASTAAVPIIMLTAKGAEMDRVVGLELGADDYVVKPFSPRELILRVKAVLKRGAAGPGEQQTLSRRGVNVDLGAHRASAGDKELALTATEFKLLADLLANPGRVRSREQLLGTVWGYTFDGYARTVDTHVRRLRQKMGGFAECIETVRGAGYRFKD